MANNPIPKEVLRMEVPDLANWLMANVPGTAIATKLAEMLKEKKPETQITVSQEDFDRITAMFKVRGQRCVDGNFVEERRGRPRATTNKD